MRGLRIDRRQLTILTRAFLVAVLCAGLSFLLTFEWPDRSSEDYAYDSVVLNRRFDFVGWEVDALTEKALYSLASAHAYLQAESQKSLVLDFLDQLGTVQALQTEISSVYADPAVTNPDEAAASLTHQLIQARIKLDLLRPLAEGVLEEQISAVLVDEGISATGRAFPPLQLRFSPLPTMLVVSPRDRIEGIRFIPLLEGLDTPVREEIEKSIDRALDVSSLVVDIGGLAAYPAMMYKSTSLNWLAETGAHEWTHHYLTLNPLGILYDTSPEMRTMNETTASIVGKEIGAQVIQRFYPELAPARAPAPSTAPTPDPAEPPAWNYQGRCAPLG